MKLGSRSTPRGAKSIHFSVWVRDQTRDPHHIFIGPDKGNQPIFEPCTTNVALVNGDDLLISLEQLSLAFKFQIILGHANI